MILLLTSTADNLKHKEAESQSIKEHHQMLSEEQIKKVAEGAASTAASLLTLLKPKRYSRLRGRTDAHA